MGLKISEGFVYAAMPVGFGLIIVIKLEKYYKLFLNRKINSKVEGKYGY
jgi:TRAP-type C4-dicarboxylate transport system permease small subunit